MRIRVNGHSLQIENTVTTIEQLIKHLQLNSKIIIVEQNGEIQSKEKFEQKIQEGDSFEIVTFVGGG